MYLEKLVPQLYGNYGRYVNQNKMLPNCIDGLLPVQKRILLTAHTIAKGSYVKTTKILGECMARWHPFSEALGTASWAVQNEFLDGGGSWGSKIGTEPIGCAAPRYTKIKANNRIEELAFKYVKHVEWKEIEADPEPLTLPTMIPFCLMGKYEMTSIAFGYKTEIPCYKYTDLIKRLMFLLELEKEYVPAPNIINCKVTSKKKELKQLLQKGNGRIQIQGKYTEDKKNWRIYINGWSPRTKFQTLLDKIDRHDKNKILSNSDVGFIDQSTKSNGTRIRFEVQKQRNKEEIYNKMLDAIKTSLEDSLTYGIITVNSNGITEENSVDQMLLNSFNFYTETVSVYFKHQISDLKNKIKEYDVIKNIRPHLSKVLQIKDTPEKMCLELSKLTKINIDIIKEIVSKYQIRKLMSVSLDIKETEKIIKEYTNNLKDVKSFCVNEYGSLL